MASLLPLISELLPMVMPAATQVIRAGDLAPTGPTVEGPVTQRRAVVGKCGMCATVLTIRPKYSTSIRHNSEQDTIMYSIAGPSTVRVKEGFEDELHVHELSTGDFIFIAAWTEHQVCNDSDQQDAVWLVVQHGSHPVGAELADWGGAVTATHD